MDAVYTLMMYGLAAIMIVVIATITAGIILGTVLMLASLVRKVRGAPRPASGPAVDRYGQAPTNALV